MADMKNKNELIHIIVFNIVIILLLLVASFYLYFSKDGIANINFRKIIDSINYECLIFSSLGVIFHLMSKYRELRDTGNFDLKKYGFDYIFSIIQAAIYVILINAIINNDKSSSDTIPYQLYIISLLVGMYISKLESSFDDFGNRFSDTIKGLLGSSLPNLTEAEKKKNIEELFSRLKDLKITYNSYSNKMDQAVKKIIEDKFELSLNLIKTEKYSDAQLLIYEIEYNLSEYI